MIVFQGIVRQWQHACLALVLLLAWIVFIFRETAIAIVTIWARSETFTHGFLVLPIVLWLVWRKRHIISQLSPRPSFGIAILIIGAGFFWLLGEFAAVNAVTQASLVALLVLSVPAVVGVAVSQRIIFPLAFMFFAVPVGEFLMPQLMEWTADFTVIALRLTGIPVYREGLQFVIPSGNWSVVEACSGVRYLIASLTVGSLFAYLSFQSATRRILFVLVSIVVPVFANWLRAYLIVIVGHLSGNKLAAGVDHLIYGWLFFGVVIMLMFVVGARWAEPDKSDLKSSLADQSPKRLTPVSAPVLWSYTFFLALLTTLPILIFNKHSEPSGDHAFKLTAPIELTSNWKTTVGGIEGFRPAFQNPSAELSARFENNGRTVGMYIGAYRNQNYTRKLVSSTNVLISSSDAQWVMIDKSNRAIVLGDKSVDLRVARLRNKLSAQGIDEQLVVWQVYWINGTLTANDYLAKVYSALYRLAGRGDESAVIVLYADAGQKVGADALLEDFLTANFEAINQILRGTLNTDR